MTCVVAKYSGTGGALAHALLVSTLLEPWGRSLADDPHQPAGPGGVCDLTSTIASDDSHSGKSVGSPRAASSTRPTADTLARGPAQDPVPPFLIWTLISCSDGRRHATSMHAAGVDRVLQSQKPRGHNALIPSI